MNLCDGVLVSTGLQHYIEDYSEGLRDLRARYARGEVLEKDLPQWQADVLEHEKCLARAERPPLVPAVGEKDRSFKSIREAIKREISTEHAELSSEEQLEKLDAIVALIDKSTKKLRNAVDRNSTFKTRTSALANLIAIADSIVHAEGAFGDRIRQRYRDDEDLVTSMLYIINDCMTASERWFLCVVNDNESRHIEVPGDINWLEEVIAEHKYRLFNDTIWQAASAMLDGYSYHPDDEWLDFSEEPPTSYDAFGVSCEAGDLLPEIHYRGLTRSDHNPQTGVAPSRKRPASPSAEDIAARRGRSLTRRVIQASQHGS